MILPPVLRAFLVALAAALALATAPTAQSEPAAGYRIVAGPEPLPAGALERVDELVAAGLAQLAADLPRPTRPFVVVVHRSLTAAPPSVRDHLHEGTPGVALLASRTVHLLLDEAAQRPPNDPYTVVVHELVHILLDDLAGRARRFLPRWLHEGLAQELSGATYLGAREDDLVFRARTQRLFRFVDLRRRFPNDPDERRLAYAQSFSFVAFLRRELGLPLILRAARRADERDGFRSGIVAETGRPMIDFVDRWTEHVASGSGAGFRLAFQNCFAYTMIFGFVLLAAAGSRRWNRDHAKKIQLAREEAERLEQERQALEGHVEESEVDRPGREPGDPGPR